MNLAEWLLEQIDEDELTAREANMEMIRTDRAHRWTADRDKVSDGLHFVAESRNYFLSRHIGTWDPARVIAECAAKRRIIADCQQYRDDTYPEDEDESAAATDGLSARALTYLALPYADRPGYREEWRPEPSTQTA